MSKDRHYKNGIVKTQGAQAAGALRAAFAPCTQKFRRNFGYFGPGNRLPFGLAISRGAHPAPFFKKISAIFFAKSGQQVIEYALVITAISVALTIMYVYTKRGLQSVIKSTVDAEIGTQRDSGVILSIGDSQAASSTSFAVARDNSRTIKTGGDRQYIFDSASENRGNSTTIANAFKGGTKNCVSACIGVGCEVCP